MPSCHSVHDLELAVQDLWAHLPQDNLRCLINSMPHRVAACIAAGDIGRLDGVVGFALALYAQAYALKSVDFHGAENRRRSCRMIFRQVKVPLSAYLA
ncbi:transposable element Tcb2 transposase [Trichonephila clavipes]|nr:transposable element Tcb2 transposase [Trichonephila clavipes]